MSDYCDTVCKDFFSCTATIPATQLDNAESVKPCPIYPTVRIRKTSQDAKPQK